MLGGAIGGGLWAPGLRTVLALASVAAMGLLARHLTPEDGPDASWGLVAGAAFVGMVVLLACVVPPVLLLAP